MKILLDTVTFLWMYFGDRSRFSHKALRILEDSPEIYFSAVSAWEIAIKYSLGKLDLKKPPQVWLERSVLEMGLRPLSITTQHGVNVSELPQHHKDPFDRLLISQAKSESLPILTPDSAFKDYKVTVIW